MRILMLALQFGASKNGTLIGGITNNLARLCMKLANKGHEVYVISTEPPFPEATSNRRSTHPIARILTLKSAHKHASIRTGVSYFVKALIHALRLHKEFQFSVVHGHSAYPIFGLMVRVVSKLLRIPGIFSLYSPIGEGRNLETYFRFLQNRILVSRLFLAGLKCTATSLKGKQSLDRIGIKDSEFIYPFVSFSRFRPLNGIERSDIRLRYSIGPDEFTLFYIGNLSRTKGLRELLFAVSRMEDDLILHNVKLAIALDMPLAESKRKLRPILNRMNLDRYVVFIGIDSQIEKLMGASDIVVAPFRNTFGPADPPLSIIEAMASGCAVLSTQVGGIPEIVEDGVSGYLVQPCDVGDITERLKSALQNKQKNREIGLQAAINVRSALNPSEQVLRYLQIYRRPQKQNH